MNWIELLMDIFLHIALIAVAIPSIFFIYGTILQKKIIKREVSLTIYDAIRPYIPIVVKHFENTSIDQVTTDISNSAGNVSIRNTAYLYLGAMSACSLFVFAVLAFINNEGVPYQLMIENVVLTGFVIITELIFFTYIAAKYRPIDIDKIKLLLVNPFNPASC